MAITSGFFDSVNSDRLYNAEQMSHYFDGLISDGVYESVGGKFNVTSAYDGMKVNVASGRAIIKCHWIYNDEQMQLTLPPSDATYNRIDAIILKLDRDARSITLEVKTGTPAASATMPEMTRNDHVWELCLATALVLAGGTQPYQIWDYRGSSLCGWVTGLINQVDTSTLFAQWQAAYNDQYNVFSAFMLEKMTEFNNWFSTLTQQLAVYTNLVKYMSSYQILSNGQQFARIGITEFDPDSDILFAYKNRLYMQEGEDYTIDGHHNTIIFTNPAWVKANDVVSFVVLKNTIGGDIIEPTFTNPIASTVNNNVVGTFTYSEV